MSSPSPVSLRRRIAARAAVAVSLIFASSVDRSRGESSFSAVPAAFTLSRRSRISVSPISPAAPSFPAMTKTFHGTEQ